MRSHNGLSVYSDRPRRHWLLRSPAAGGLVYAASWVAGLLIFSSSAQVRSSGAQLLATYSGHQGVATLQFVLTEGVPALALAVVVWALARAARAAGEGRLALAALGSGLGAATISFTQFLLGVYFTGRVIGEGHADAAASLNVTINRLDGPKMFLLAALALVGIALIRRGRLELPRWLTYVGPAMAATIVISGVGYVFLLSGPALAAWVSLPLLLVWVTSLGVVLARIPSPKH